MVVFKRAIEPYERKKAKERQLTDKPFEETSKGGNGDSREKVAGFLGVSLYSRINS